MVAEEPALTRPVDPDDIGKYAKFDGTDVVWDTPAGGSGGGTPGLVGDLSAIEIGDAATAGATGRYADAAHQHALAAPATPAALGASAATGAATAPARADHVHPYPTAAQVGAATSGHTHSGVYEPAGTASTEVAAHAALADPHPGYLLEADGPELIRDTMATALVPGSNVTITVSDGADTITIASSVTSAVYDPLDTVAASGSATSADISTHGVVDITLTGNCTISITGPTAGQGWSATFILRQDGTGSRTVSWPAGTVWPGGSEPTLSTAAGAIDIVVLMTVDGGTEWFGSLAGKGFS